MYLWNTRDHAFFRLKPDPIDRRPPPEGGAPLPPLVAEGRVPLMADDVVVGYDGQAGSIAALRTATGIAAAFGRPLVIVFGYRPAPIGGDVADLGRAVRDVGQRMGEDALAHGQLDRPGASCATVELVDDRPAEALLRAGDEHDALVIVVGTTGRGPITGSLLGSVTYQVVHRSTRPVLVVRCLPATDLPPAYDPHPWVRGSARSCRSRWASPSVRCRSSPSS